MHYIFVTLLLFALLLVYFKIADKYNIIDKPNHRSAHTEITLRGGGVIFPIAFLLFLGSQIIQQKSLISPQNYFIFGIGLLAICIVSFIDDILDLSSKIRLVFHFISVSLLLCFINAFQLLPIWSIPILFIVIIGILNAYNFMDGINGMTGLYSLVTLGSLLYINQNFIAFTDNNFIIYPILASLVFLFFNFRKKARCFAGDVGSMSIAIWLMALLGLAILKTNNYQYLLFLSIYGIEVVLTIVQRLKLKENIFEAHRHHLYQLLVNQLKWSHLAVSTLYGFLQFTINFMMIRYNLSFLQGFIFLVLPLCFIYIFSKYTIFKKTGAY